MFLNVLTNSQKQLFLAIAKKFISADGDVSPQEKAVLAQYESEVGMGFYADNYSDDELKEGFVSEHSKTALMLELIGLGWLDGEYGEEEQQFVENIKELLNISDDNYALYCAWVEKQFMLQKESASFFK